MGWRPSYRGKNQLRKGPVRYLRAVDLMPVKPPAPNRPWRLRVPDAVLRPKGSRDFLVAAVEELAPYQGTWVRDDGSRRKLSKKLAIELVSGIARRFNSNAYLARDAPRFSDVIQRMTELKRRSSALAEYIENLDDLTIRLLQLARHTTQKDRLPKLMAAADVQALGPRGRHRSMWAQRLFSLSEGIDLVMKRLLNRRSREGRGITDRGGRTNKFMEDEGIPRWRLVTDLLYIHQIFKPALATSTAGKSFHRFVLNVFEYATGKEGETFARVDYWIKRLVKATREEDALLAHIRALGDELEAMAHEKEPTEEYLKRVVAVIRQQNALFSEREKLMDITWPHSKIRGWSDKAGQKRKVGPKRSRAAR